MSSLRTSIESAASAWREWLPKTLLLIAAALWAFSPTFHGVFLWDDTTNITNNALMHDPLGWWKILLGAESFAEYDPLTKLVEWLLWQTFGDNVVPYHGTTVSLHILNALLVWALFARLRLPFAWVGGLLFAIHPVTVESVAWITELKNTIFLGPLLLTMLLVVHWEETGDKRAYYGALACLAVSLLAKSAGIMLPVVTLGYAWWLRGTITWKDCRAAVPFFVVVAIDVLIVFYPRQNVFPYQPTWNLAEALAVIGWTPFFVLGKCVWPAHLMPIYPGFYGRAPALLDVMPWLSLAITAALLWWARRSWGRHLLFGLGFFMVNLVPVFIYMLLHYTSMIWSLDHLVYLPMIGVIGLFVAGLGAVKSRISNSGQVPLGVAVTALVATFGWMTHTYCGWWVAQDEFWLRTLKANPDAWSAHDSYGLILASRGKYAEALREYDAAFKANPHASYTFVDRGITFGDLGRTKEAEESYQQAIAENPVDAEPYIRLGQLLESQGRKEEAVVDYEGAVKRLPDSAQLHFNLGTLYLNEGNIQGALEHLEISVQLDPSIPPAHENLGSALARLNRVPEALAQFQKAVDLQPGYLMARANLARALAQTGRIDEAIGQFEEVLRLDPGNVQAQQNLIRLQQYEAQNPPAGGSK